MRVGHALLRHRCCLQHLGQYACIDHRGAGTELQPVELGYFVSAGREHPFFVEDTAYLILPCRVIDTVCRAYDTDFYPVILISGDYVGNFLLPVTGGVDEMRIGVQKFARREFDILHIGVGLDLDALYSAA